MTTLTSIARRGSLLGFAVALVAATVAPALTFADNSLNPLTERSLLLTSSSPGWHDTDGSGNSEAAPGVQLGSDGVTPLPGHYAAPGSGPNGKKTGQTFSFKVSTDSRDVIDGGTGRAIKGFTFQYCTTAAGICLAPGNNVGGTTGTPRGADTATTSDLNVNYTDAEQGTDFDIYVGGVLQTGTGWTLTTKNFETPIGGDQTVNTGKNNFIRLTHATGIKPAFNTNIRIVFKASTDNYITNPGSGSFFVKMNTFDSDDADDHIDSSTFTTGAGTSLIDGGVTVANVMTTSIHITTKVLETMSFSVGTENPDSDTDLLVTEHAPCNAITVANNNRLNLGNPLGEYSLETGTTYEVASYWRLSSNSSGGATVYYSGDTLRNTVGDKITAMEDKGPSVRGKEQFGLAFADLDAVAPLFQGLIETAGSGYFTPSIDPLNMEDDYKDGNGTINGGGTAAQFKFVEDSITDPEVIAQNNDSVLRCATAKMRYIGNIAADTPAGVYTTKINYLAAPQY